MQEVNLAACTKKFHQEFRGQQFDELLSVSFGDSTWQPLRWRTDGCVSSSVFWGGEAWFVFFFTGLHTSSAYSLLNSFLVVIRQYLSGTDY